MIIRKETINRYASARNNTYKSIVCHAPFVNLNFEQNGNVRACCYNREEILGKWPDQSIRQIWHGPQANLLRKRIRNNDLGGGCTECGKMIEAGNFQGVRALFFDDNAPDNLATRLLHLKNQFTGGIGYPRVMEFELSNKCNLECVMCNGYFSSSIRKNREKLSPVYSPYNEKFVNELDEFIPHLTDAKFLGGEPFMIDIYLSIWERILKIKPEIRIHITTNGTFLTDRVKELLEGLNAGIIVSIDSVVKETYEKIRVNGNYERVMANLDYFRDYTFRKKTFISMAVCPIIHNWKELPGILDFCLSKNVALYFNVVFTPFELSLREQAVEMQQEILEYLERQSVPMTQDAANTPRDLSIKAYNDFVKLLKSWLDERKTMVGEKKERLGRMVQASVPVEVADAPVEWSTEKVSKALIDITALEWKGLFDEEKNLKMQLGQLLIVTPEGRLSESLSCYLQLHQSYHHLADDSNVVNKLKAFAMFIDGNPHRDKMLSSIAMVSPMFFAKWIHDNSMEKINDSVQQFLRM